MKIFHYIFIICIIKLFLCNVACFDEYSYKAAVLEYSPDFTSSNENSNVFETSVPDYIKYIQKAAAEDVDIIVFPEGGLTVGIPKDRNKIQPYGTEVPDPVDQIAPCNSTKFGQHLRNISCAAALNKIYVAMNLVEIYDCTNEPKCPADKVFIYNTNIVLDRNGIIIARYRKYNLFVEPGFDITDTPQLILFDTDFNVTFGIFICFDILFQTPALELVRSKHVHDFIYSASWLSELPFLTAVQTQVGWAYSNQVTLLASGHNYPKEGRGGSGIYLGKQGPLVHIFPLSRQNIMLVSKIPKYPFSQDFKLMAEKSEYILKLNNFKQDEIILRQEPLKNYTTKIIKTNSFIEEICNEKLCCKFEIKSDITNSIHYIYRAVVFNGVRSYQDLVKAGSQVCGIVSCINESIESCGLRNRTVKTGFIFNTIKIRGNFMQNNNTFQWASTLNSNLLPYNPRSFKYINTNDHIELSLTESVEDLLTFGIQGRNYAEDERLRQ